MGNQASDIPGPPRFAVGKPLVAQRDFVGTIHKRFVKGMAVTLEFEDQFWNKPHKFDIEIRDATHHKVLFRVPPPKTDDTTRKLLLDAYGVPVVGMEQHAVLPKEAKCTQFAVIPGGFAAAKAIYRFETRFNAFDHPLTLTLDLYVSTPQQTRIIVVGQHHWLARRALIAIQTGGSSGTMYTIARQRPFGNVLDGKYQIEVAAGVDLALVVLLAAAMDESNRKHEDNFDRMVIKAEAKRYAKAEKKALKAQLKAQRAQAKTEPPRAA